MKKESVLSLAARAYAYSISLSLIYVKVEIDKYEKGLLIRHVSDWSIHSLVESYFPDPIIWLADSASHANFPPRPW